VGTTRRALAASEQTSPSALLLAKQASLFRRSGTPSTEKKCSLFSFGANRALSSSSASLHSPAVPVAPSFPNGAQGRENQSQRETEKTLCAHLFLSRSRSKLKKIETKIPSCPALTSKYTPPPFLTGAHAQTLFNRLRSLTVDAGYARQLLPCPAAAGSSGNDGPTTVVLDWVRGSDCPLAAAPSAPVLLILHGAAGSSADCKHAAVGAADRGWRAAVLTLRRRGGGSSGGPAAAPTPAASREAAAAAAASAVRTALCSINDRFPHAPLLGLGYAAGGAVLVRVLAEAAAKGGSGSGRGGHRGNGGAAKSRRRRGSEGAGAGGSFGSASAASLGGASSPRSSSGVPRLAAAVAISSPLGDGAAARAAVAAAGPGGLGGLDSLYARRVGAAFRRAVSTTATAAASVGASQGRRREGPYDAPDAAASDAAAARHAGAPPSPTSTPSSSSSVSEAVRRSASPEEGGDHSSSPSHTSDNDGWLSHDAATLDAVRRIDAPTLLLAAADDPFVRGAWPPLVEAVRGNATGSAALAVTARGGHLGFLTGASGLGLSWAEEAALQFLGEWADDGGGEERDDGDDERDERIGDGERFNADDVAAANTAAFAATAAAFEAATAAVAAAKRTPGGASASSSASHLSSGSSAGGAGGGGGSSAGGGGGGGASDGSGSAIPESPRGVIASAPASSQQPQQHQKQKQPAIKQQQQALSRVPRRVPTVSASLALLGSGSTRALASAAEEEEDEEEAPRARPRLQACPASSA